MKIVRAGVISLFGMLSISIFTANAVSLNDCANEPEAYTVQTGDYLYTIALEYGDDRFWELIYVKNADQIDNPSLIHPDQVLLIPHSIMLYHHGEYSVRDVFEMPFCNLANIPLEDVKTEYLTLLDLDELKAIEERELMLADEPGEDDVQSEEEILEKFREAFSQLTGDSVEENEHREQESHHDTEEEILLVLDGLVLDETRTKVGRDFYDIFYQNWQAPQDARNFTIRISEQPTPNLGTIISVSVNGTDTFRHRLQPRYEFIEEASQYAVRMTYNHLEGHQQQMRIY
jgi:hypothetical protein